MELTKNDLTHKILMNMFISVMNILKNLTEIRNAVRLSLFVTTSTSKMFTM